jgi:hypothetical protein
MDPSNRHSERLDQKIAGIDPPRFPDDSQSAICQLLALRGRYAQIKVDCAGAAGALTPVVRSAQSKTNFVSDREGVSLSLHFLFKDFTQNLQCYRPNSCDANATVIELLCA